MTFFSTRSLLASSALALVITLAPSTAAAGGSIHLHGPGISVGFHGKGYGKSYRHGKSYHNRSYNGRSFKSHSFKSRNFKNRSFGKSYRNNYRHGYRSKYRNYNSYGNKNYYNKKKYYKRQNYYGKPNYYGRGYSKSYRSSSKQYRNDYDYCPTAGYSSTYYPDQECYSHSDHYHCNEG